MHRIFDQFSIIFFVKSGDFWISKKSTRKSTDERPCTYNYFPVHSGC